MNDEIKALMPKKPYLDDFKIYPANGSGKVLVAYTDVYDYYDREIVALFENARVVYGRVDGNHGWADGPGWVSIRNGEQIPSTHTALLLNIKPIDQAVTKAEVLRMLRCLSVNETISICSRIERFGLKP